MLVSVQRLTIALPLSNELQQLFEQTLTFHFANGFASS